ncbi:DNA helicase-2/ATP-dependent DNA helicase PcrA [Caldicoprobacter guelmensis]|nr:DNA helicase PcrA [Caldicoprobacter guelmensis]MBM7581886.1 DNA helicase-2/ATP-dependent DNA helicase PcrA [Caldicoprobacter guelmensis]
MTEDIKKRFCALRDEIIKLQYQHLNEMQRKAVLTTQGPLLVLAGAGSGKTTVLVNRIAHLLRFGCAYGSDHVPKGLSVQDIDAMGKYLSLCRESGKVLPLTERIYELLRYRVALPGSILAITFTNKAAKEMKERIVNIVGEAAHDIWVSTFHSACVRILRREIDKMGYSRNFVIYDESDQLTVIKDCVKELDLNEKYYQPKEIRDLINRLKDQMIGPQEYMSRAYSYREENIGRIYQLYEAKLKKNCALDFGDLINKTVELFRLRPDVLDYYQKKFQYILVDEYQDTNMAQYMFIKMLSEFHGNVCAVGDDDQAIYGWRGADIRNILEFEKDFPDAVVIKLEENYRSSQTILDAANNVIKNNRGRKPKKLWTRHKQGEKVRIYQAYDEHDEADFICRKIKDLMQQEEYKAGDFAVLYRVNAQSRVLEEAMIKYGIPYRIYKGLRFYDRKEIKDVIAYLRVIVNPADDVSLKRVINVPKRGIGPATIEALERAAVDMGESMFGVAIDLDKNGVLSGRAAASVKAFIDLIIRLIALKDTMGIVEFINTVLEETGYVKELESEGTMDALARLENIKEFISAAREFEEANEGANIVDFLENIALVSDVDQVGEDESAVVLMTLHSAKGLEFPVVFIAGMEEGLFPLSRAVDNPDELEEERRLCYVGLTRAKQRLYLSYAQNRTLYGSSMLSMPSRFLSEIPEDLVEPVDRGYAFGRGDLVFKSRTSIDSSDRFDLPARATKGKADSSVGASSSRFALGDKVLHQRFGVGTIVAMDGDGDDLRLQIAFEQGGIKKFMANLAPLKKL